MFLVTGATGKVGRAVVAGLLEEGAAVRAFVRDPGAARLPEGIEVARGDLTDPASFEAALKDVESVFLLWPGLPVEYAGADLEAIGRHARHVVYVSALGVTDDGPPVMFHNDLERAIRRSGVEWTFLRAGGFAGNTLQWAGQIRANGAVRAPYGRAARSLIHERDIAAVAVTAMTRGGHAGRSHPLTGPEALTQIEQVRLIGEALGRPVSFEEVSPETEREQMLAQGWSAEFADAALAYWATLVDDPEPVLPTVAEVTGGPATPFRRWARDHADDFR